jgi:N-acetyl-alpha-D-glucosaminyl L-malate synthase BshA
LKIGIACYPSFGGSGVVASELGRALVKKGHTVHLFSYRIPFRLDLAQDGIHFHEVSDPNYPLFEHPSYGLALAAMMAQVARDEGLDLMHVHYAFPHSISAILARKILALKHLGVITTLHGTDITLVGRDPKYYDMIRWGIESSDKLTAVSRTLREQTISLFKTSREIKVIPNFVNIREYRPIRRKKSDKKTIVYISNFRPVKRAVDAVMVFDRVRRKVPARLVMVGDGPDLAVAKEIAGNLDVEFVAPTKEVAPILAQSDVALITSEMESFGLVALEAMACGVPVVATRCGGIEEIVKEGKNGYFAPVGDVNGLADRCVEVLSDSDLAAKLGFEGRRLAETCYETSRVVSQYECLYRSFLK